MDYVSSVLTSWGVDHQTHVTGTGIVAHVRGKKPESRTVALRADMDALPITEANAVDYASTNPGVMHACGHDVHTTSLLGALRILQLTSDGWSGTVRCIFQPGEECIPGGAKGMVAAGVLKNPEPEGIFGQHVFPDLPAGDVGIRGGVYMASADEIHLAVKGQGGHAALPHKCRDAVLAASNVVVAAQQLVARLCPPGNPPSVVWLHGSPWVDQRPAQRSPAEGTFRAMDEGWRHEAHKALTALIQSTCQAHGCEADLDIRLGYLR